MAWNYKVSKARIEQHLANMGEIEIKKLTRDADLDSLLSETCCRQIYGAHVYAHVSNFSAMASKEIEDENDYKGFIRAMHLYQREVARIVEKDGIFDGVRIHFQGAKLHALFFRPIDDSETISTRAVLLQLVLKDFLSSVFNPAFLDCGDFRVAGGADIGDAIGTRNGTRGDRELLFLGAPANHAAKIISSHGRLRITDRVYEALPNELQEICDPAQGEKGIYQIQAVSQARLDELLEEYGVGWHREASKKRIENDKEQFPISDIAYGSATQLIDIDELSIRRNKRVIAASIFGDVTGFTAHIDAADTDDKRREALEQFHAIRKEMAAIVRTDYGAIRVQFQGDRVQAIVHLPKDEDAGISEKAVDIAIGLQSSLEKSLKDCLSGIGKLHLAAGVDLGETLVTKLGTRGHRDRICIGAPVEAAASCEERCEGKEIGISKAVYEALPDRQKNHFIYSQERRCYLATDLTADKVERAEKASVYGASSHVYVTAGTAGIAVSSKESSSARPVVPSKPYAS
jgi:class 3 adenylate cyclase